MKLSARWFWNEYQFVVIFVHWWCIGARKSAKSSKIWLCKKFSFNTSMHQNDPKLVFIRISAPGASSWCIESAFLVHVNFKWFCTFSWTNSPPYKFVIRGNREYRCTKCYVKGLCGNQRMWFVAAEALFCVKSDLDRIWKFSILDPFWMDLDPKRKF